MSGTTRGHAPMRAEILPGDRVNCSACGSSRVHGRMCGACGHWTDAEAVQHLAERLHQARARPTGADVLDGERERVAEILERAVAERWPAHMFWNAIETAVRLLRAPSAPVGEAFSGIRGTGGQP